MSVRIDLRKLIFPYILFLAVLATVLAVVSFCAHMLWGVAMVALWTLASYAVLTRRAFRHVDARSVYDIGPARVTQSVGGKVIKELSCADGMRVYRRAELFQIRAYLVCARVEIPKGAKLGEWRDSPDVIMIPYNIYMSKLTRMYEEATPI